MPYFECRLHPEAKNEQGKSAPHTAQNGSESPRLAGPLLFFTGSDLDIGSVEKRASNLQNFKKTQIKTQRSGMNVKHLKDLDLEEKGREKL